MADFSKLTLGSTQYDVKDATARQNITSLEGKIGTVPANSTVMAEIAKAQTAASYDDTALAGRVTANENAISAINNETTGILKNAKDYADGKETSIKGIIGTVADGKTVVGLIGENTQAIADHKTLIDSTVSTLVGSDTNKSVRTIANEELAKQLIPESAQESLDTLEEIAAWIQAHPGDASEMNTKITTLEGAVGTKKVEGDTPVAATGIYKDIDDVNERIDSLVGGDGLGDLAYKDTVSTSDITDKNVTLGKLADDVQVSLGKADSAYQLPSGGITTIDLAEAVKTSLGKADSAVQITDVVSTTKAGVVPAITNTANFLKGDGTWAEPISATYDTETETLTITW